jgi:hypothetical protein
MARGIWICCLEYSHIPDGSSINTFLYNTLYLLMYELFCWSDTSGAITIATISHSWPVCSVWAWYWFSTLVSIVHHPVLCRTKVFLKLRFAKHLILDVLAMHSKMKELWRSGGHYWECSLSARRLPPLCFHTLPYSKLSQGLEDLPEQDWSAQNYTLYLWVSRDLGQGSGSPDWYLCDVSCETSNHSGTHQSRPLEHWLWNTWRIHLFSAPNYLRKGDSKTTERIQEHNVSWGQHAR